VVDDILDGDGYVPLTARRARASSPTRRPSGPRLRLAAIDADTSVLEETRHRPGYADS